MGQGGLFSENEPAAGRAVLQRHGLHLHATVFIDDLLLCGVNGVEHHLIFQSVAEIAYLPFQRFLQVLMCIDVQGCCASEQSEG